MLTILRVAEEGLAGLAAEAGAQREYVDAAALLEAARRVQEIGETTLLTDGHPEAAEPAKSPTAPAASVAKIAAAAARPTKGRKPKKADYPKFFRDGDTLVKVGWSKSEGSEYEHKCPKRVLDVLVAELVRVSGPGKRFVMDKVLPLHDPNSRAEYPTYQPYIALAFLREAGLVEQHGRSGYSIPKSSALAAGANAAWGETTPR